MLPVPGLGTLKACGGFEFESHRKGEFPTSRAGRHTPARSIAGRSWRLSATCQFVASLVIEKVETNDTGYGESPQLSPQVPNLRPASPQTTCDLSRKVNGLGLGAAAAYRSLRWYNNSCPYIFPLELQNPPAARRSLSCGGLESFLVSVKASGPNLLMNHLKLMLCDNPAAWHFLVGDCFLLQLACPSSSREEQLLCSLVIQEPGIILSANSFYIAGFKK